MSRSQLASRAARAARRAAPGAPGRRALLPALACSLAALGAILSGCGENSADPGDGAEDRRLSGGATTVFDASSSAFTLPAPNLSGPNFVQHADGDAAFERTFVTAPGPLFDGLGPIFNRSSCAGCHVRNGGAPGSFLLRVSLPGTREDGGPVPVPGFGLQIQDRAVLGVKPEATVALTYEEVPGSFPDGTPYSLRRPRHELLDPYTALPAGVLISPRVPPPVIGLGLLEAIDEATLFDLAARGAGRGVSGRPNVVWDTERGMAVVGRFGWKANEPTLRQQAADAYNGDMGITSPVDAYEPGDGQEGHHDGIPDDPEVDEATLAATAFYTQTLAVPARRDVDDPVVLRGERLFDQTGCVSCHVSRVTTGVHPSIPELSHQVIFPFSDLLLHDMGPGLSDGRRDFEAEGNEWRTPPLWGLGLFRTVNGEEELLHDGRARSALEAILWHGGEADSSRRAFERLDADDREAMLKFLRSL